MLKTEKSKNVTVKCLLVIIALLIIPFQTLAVQNCMDASQLGPVYYMQPNQVDLISVVGPPPAPSSPQGEADLRAVLAAQRARTLAEIDEAAADSCLSIFRFNEAIGPGFKPANLPFTIVFLQRVFDDGMRGIAAAKQTFNRPRPFVADKQITPSVAQSANASYPSGTATFAYMTAILLANMLPEKALAIFDRASSISQSRVIAGVHYPSDLDAGRIAAAVIDNVLLHDAAFETDLAKSRIEVRHAAGVLSP
ncbi:MAG TPA: phosphatase PAP2 family protein [Candidatus Binataceae bacterium]|nr:phosphatase PAP2 family protein [Candidatus Binataceae bacterium]